MGELGAAKLNQDASALLWSATFDKLAHRIDAGKDGIVAVVTKTQTDYDNETGGATIRVLSAAGVEIGNFGGASAWNGDVCVDTKTQTVFTIGTKNFSTVSVVGGQSLPVYVPAVRAMSYAGIEKFVMYDWSDDPASPRWLNKSANNMADVKAERCEIGPDGNLYVIFEVAGGNHALRYSPTDIMVPAPIVGGDNNSGFSNTTTAPKLFLGKYRTSDGTYLLGQQFTPRLPNGSDNTFRTKNGDLAIDKLGRVFVAASTAFGLPITHEYLPGTYTGGSALVMFSPDFATRELCTRFSTSGILRTVAVGPNGQVAMGGSTVSSDLFTYQPAQATMQGTDDGFYTTANFAGLYSWNPAAQHPRLYFSAAEVTALRAKATQAPFNAMLTKMDQGRGLSDFGNLPFDSLDHEDVGVRISLSAFMYLITQNETYAIDAKKWTTKYINGQISPWASASLKGLTSYWMTKHTAEAYDWCFSSPNWDENFRYTVSAKLKVMADMITSNGGTEQATDDASNWQGNRSGSAIISYLALDHPYTTTNYNTMWTKLNTYIDANLGSQSGSKGWNLEGLGYTYYPWGNFIGPAGIAAKRVNPANDIRTRQSVRNTFFTTLASNSTAYDLKGFGGSHPDWSDDNANCGGEGTYGQAFYYLDSAMVPSFKHVYDRHQGTLAPFGTKWDATRGGTIWSYIYYPASLASEDPTTSTSWKSRYVDNTGGNGLMTYRNAYTNGDDHIAQFKIKLRNSSGAHDGPDALGFRIAGAGAVWAVGGGRNTPGNFTMQAGLYKANPFVTLPSANRNLSTVIGTPISKPDGSGHAIGNSTTTNVGVAAHKRWFVASYATASTGADATYIIGDESTDGLFWEMPTFTGNTIGTSGNTFTVTAANGATMRGTVLFPTASPSFATGSALRGSAFGDSLNNKYLTMQSANGDYLVVLTVKKTGSHPAVAYSGTGIMGSTVTVGTATFNLTNTDVIYGGGARISAEGAEMALSSFGPLLSLYPNPSNGGRFTLALSGATGQAQVQIVDSKGSIVLTQAIDAEQPTQFSIPTQHAPGVYLINVRLANGTRISQRMIK